MPADRDFELLAKPGAPQALVVTPTRELASQVSKDLHSRPPDRHARVLTVYGGVGYEPQLRLWPRASRSSSAPRDDCSTSPTAGRSTSATSRCSCWTRPTRCWTSASCPTSSGSLAKTPELRQTMLFSATMPAAIVSLARRHLRHPVNIRAESADDTTTVPATAQFVYQAHELDKPEVVARILQAENRNRVMIFCRTKRSAQRVADDLAERGFSAAAIHGDLTRCSARRR